MTRARALLARWTPRGWWTARSGRERLLLSVLAGALVSYMLLAGALQPLLAARAEARAAIARYDAALARLASLPDGAAEVAPAADARPVSAVVTETAPAFGLTIRRIEPSGADASVVLEDAEFEAVLLWIDALERDHGLRIAAIEMERRPQPGVVSTRLGLAR